MSDQDEQTLDNQSPDSGNDGVSSSAQDALGVGGDSNVVTGQDGDGGEPLESQQDRSRLGRRFSKFEQEMEGIKSTLSQLSSTLMQREVNQPRAVNALDDAPPVEYISTPEDLEKYEAWKSAKLERQRNVYAGQYIQSVKTMSYINPDMHTEIETELLTNVNEYPTYSKFSDPVGDAKQNYLRAENKLLKQKLVVNKQPAPNVKGGNAPAGVSATSRVNGTPAPSVKLDEYASKFLRSLGEDQNADWVQKSLARQ